MTDQGDHAHRDTGQPPVRLVTRLRDAPSIPVREQTRNPDDEGVVVTLMSREESGCEEFEVGLFRMDPQQHHPTHSHDHEHDHAHEHAPGAELYYVLDGSGVITVDDHSVDAGPGTAIYLPPGTPHDVRTAGNDLTILFVSRDLTPDAPAPGPGVRKVTRLSEVDVIDAASIPGNARDEGTIATLMSRPMTGSEDFEFGIRRLTSGQAHPSHRHPGGGEVWYVISGEAIVSLDGAEIEADPGTAVYVPAGTPHGMHARTADVTWAYCHSRPDRREVGVEWIDNETTIHGEGVRP